MYEGSRFQIMLRWAKGHHVQVQCLTKIADDAVLASSTGRVNILTLNIGTLYIETLEHWKIGALEHWNI